MTRKEWKELSARIRTGARQGASNREDLFMHGGTYWTAVYVADRRETVDRSDGWFIRPAIIRDRSLSSRIAIELVWSRQYRMAAASHKRKGDYFAGFAAQAIKGAKLCVSDCQLMRLSASSRAVFEKALAQGEAIGRCYR